MPLEPTANPALPPTDRVTRRRLAGGLLALATGSTLLVGCASGNSREADRARDRDAQRTSVVDELQATKTSQLVNGSPEAESTPSAP